MVSYERTLAPSEEVSDFGARHLGFDLEWPIWAHYLTVTGADFKPGGSGVPPDWRDTGVVTDYIKMLVERHKPHLPTLDEKALQADSRIKDKLPVPDISTYRGRSVPPRILQSERGAIEDRGRCEFYEIKPNSDDGESKGRTKLANIDKSYRTHGLDVFYERGRVYPLKNPDYIPITWSKAFDYLKECFVQQHGIRNLRIDIQVSTLPDKPARGLLLYALRFRFDADDDIVQEKLREAAAGLAFAMALCAAENVLTLGFEVVAGTAAAGLLQALESLLDSQLLPGTPAPPPRFRVAPDRAGPRIASEPEKLPDEMPLYELRPDELEQTHEEVEIPRRKRLMAEAITGRGFAEPAKKFDVYCDEDYFQNVIVDPTVVQRFVAQTRVPVPSSPALLAAAGALSAYCQIVAPGFVLAHHLLDGLGARFPNQAKVRLVRTIQAELARLVGLSERREATIVSQVLPATARMAVFIDPSLAGAGRQRVDPGDPLRGRGQIVLPQSIIARWRGRDSAMGARRGAEGESDLVALLLGAQPDEARRKYLADVLADRAHLKQALHAGPGFTLAIGTHALYTRLAGAPVTGATRFGELASSIHLSRLFAVNAAKGSRPPGAPYTPVDPATLAAHAAELRSASGSYRYLGRLKLARP